jgi:hypothetical protein
VGSLGAGSGSTSGPVENRLIVLDHSIGGIRLGEPRGTVEKAFGHGTSTRRGVVSYFGGRLVVNYWFHEQLTTRVEDLETSWSGFRTRSSIHVGSSREELRALHVVCSAGLCGRAGQGPDAPGTGFRCVMARSPRSISPTGEQALSRGPALKGHSRTLAQATKTACPARDDVECRPRWARA